MCNFDRNTVPSFFFIVILYVINQYGYIKLFSDVRMNKKCENLAY